MSRKILCNLADEINLKLYIADGYLQYQYKKRLTFTDCSFLKKTILIIKPYYISTSMWAPD